MARGQFSGAHFPEQQIPGGGTLELRPLPQPPEAPDPKEWATYLSRVCCDLDLASLDPEELSASITDIRKCRPWSLEEAAGVIVRNSRADTDFEKLYGTARNLLRFFSFILGQQLRIILRLRIGPADVELRFMHYGPVPRPHPKLSPFLQALRKTDRPFLGPPLVSMFLEHYWGYLTAETRTAQFLNLWNALETLARHHYPGRNPRLGRQLLDQLESACRNVLDRSAPDARADVSRYRLRLRSVLGQLRGPSLTELIQSALEDCRMDPTPGLIPACYQIRNCLTHSGSCTRLGGPVCPGDGDLHRLRNCQALPSDVDPVAALWAVTVHVGTRLCWNIPLPDLYGLE